MFRLLINWFVTTVAILLAAYIVPGVRVQGLGAAIIAAAILGILNVLVKPLFVFLTFPITIVTFGLFLFVINALMFWLAGAIVKGFEVTSFLSALLGALTVSIVSFLLFAVF